jgi:dihydrofolate reductase
VNKTITLVAAMGRNRAIGLDGRMPWHLPAELKHFKRTTLGKPVLMGRKTWQAIGRPLPDRQNIVISRNPALGVDGARLASSLVEAVELAEAYEIMVIGGGELYRQALPLASRMVLTMVDCEPEADTWFPSWDVAEWRLLATEHHAADEQNIYSFEVNEWVRSAASTGP